MKKRTRIYISTVFIGIILLPGFSISPASAEKKLLSIDTDASCITASCHSDLAKKKFIHAPAGEGEGCVTCHEVVKDGQHGFQLTSETETLCFECHDDVVDKQFKHMPVKNGECIMCHDPHQSDNPKQLVMPPTSELCFTCHDADEFKGTTPHGPVTEGECLECHHHHTSDNRAQLKTPVPDLCFGCHSSELKDYNDISLPSTLNMFTSKNVKLHKPFAEGRCLACHFPHPSDNHRLLKEKYPSEFYATYSDKTYGFCFNCHEELKNALETPRTLTETGFRNGNLNLHYRHVNKRKGRTCRACHHHHGSNKPKLIRQTFPFGKRFMGINYEKTESGGSCSPACHSSAGYDRYEPVVNKIKTTPRQGKDATSKELLISREKDLPKKGKQKK